MDDDDDDLLSGVIPAPPQTNQQPKKPRTFSTISALPPTPPSLSRLENLYNDNKIRAEKLNRKRQELRDKESKGMFQPTSAHKNKKASQPNSNTSLELDGLPSASTPLTATTPQPSDPTNNCHNRLYKSAVLSDTKKEQNRQSSAAAALLVHTFKPQIFTRDSPINKKVNKVRQSGGKSVVERLWERDEIIKKKKEELRKAEQARECSFRPRMETVDGGGGGGGGGEDGLVMAHRSRTESTLNAVGRLYNPVNSYQGLSHK